MRRAGKIVRSGASPEAIAAEEALAGVQFPEGLRERLRRVNGGDLWIGEERWTLYPVRDSTTKASARRTSGHVARQTTALRDAFGGMFPAGAIAIGEDPAGDPLLLRPEAPRLVAWRPDTGKIEPVQIDWTPNRAPRTKPPSAPSDWIRRALRTARSSGEKVVIGAPGTPYTLTFTFRDDAVDAHAVGLARLPRIQAYHIGEPLTRELSALGWRGPEGDDAGDWHLQWTRLDWNPAAAADLAVSTFERAYGLDPRYLRELKRLGNPDAR